MSVRKAMGSVAATEAAHRFFGNDGYGFRFGILHLCIKQSLRATLAIKERSSLRLL